MRRDFVAYMNEPVSFHEFRLQGSLGFGGTFKWRGETDQPFVDCYREDETPDRINAMEHANTLLQSWWNDPIPKMRLMLASPKLLECGQAILKAIREWESNHEEHFISDPGCIECTHGV